MLTSLGGRGILEIGVEVVEGGPEGVCRRRRGVWEGGGQIFLLGGRSAQKGLCFSLSAPHIALYYPVSHDTLSASPALPKHGVTPLLVLCFKHISAIPFAMRSLKALRDMKSIARGPPRFRFRPLFRAASPKV